VIVPDLRRVEMEPSRPVIYDRPIGLRLLHRDPGTGAEHYLVHYPEGTRAERHTHSAAHTIVVLEGAMTANGEHLPAGSYVHFPAGTPMVHEPAAGCDCLFVTIFHGPFDVHPVQRASPPRTR
jgi:quercetin dioxygenase-like cupin family protein